MNSTDRLWGVKDLAEYLGIPVQTIYQWRSKGYGPPGRRIGKHVRFVPEEVRAWVASLRKDVA
jgi:excisionase family DNA binding protein